MTITEHLKKAGIKPEPKRGPIWKGPEADGITFSLLSRFLCCRERFRLMVVEGLKPADQFSHRLEYGNMHHVCEEALAGQQPWQPALTKYCAQLCRKYQTQQEQIDHWYNVCKVQFPLYVDYWAKHPDVANRTPLLAEQVFDVPYKLPSGRTVKLRGKWDSVDLVTEKNGAGVWLQENKSKSDIDEQRIKRQLLMDLQTMLYLVALDAEKDNSFWRRANKAWRGIPIKGVRYSVVRRPLSGGKGTIVRHKATDGAKCPKCKGVGVGGVPLQRCEKCYGRGRIGGKPEESKAEFYKRVEGIIKAEPDTYFMRWNVTVLPADVEKFKRQCLDPLLENLCDWWSWVEIGEPFENRDAEVITPNDSNRVISSGIHWREPFGIYDPVREGGSSDLDEYLESGSTVGLQRVDDLFPELVP